MVLDELVERIELHDPQEELALIVAQDLEMLNAIRALDGEGEVTGTRLADADQKCTIVFVGQKLLGISCKTNKLISKCAKAEAARAFLPRVIRP